jgi:HPt (histidine-containing phosphotransfer) domain-containing protein
MTRPEDVLDMSVIAALRELSGDGDESLFQELLELYVDDSTKQIQRLQEAIVKREIKVAERIAHTRKSSSANLGAMLVSKMCKEMELCGRNQSFEGMSELLTATCEAHARAVEALCALRS